MDKYTYSNIIIDPAEEGVEKLIGKEVYVGYIPGYCLEHANEGDSYYLCTLIEIRKYDTCPFLVKHNGKNEVFSCIIENKEDQKPKYVPFESKEEFLERYTEVRESEEYDTFNDRIFQCGMWLKDKETDAFFMVTEIWDDGVIITDRKMKTTKVRDDEYFTINESTTWKELLREYTFLDDSPCGKESKDV